MKRLVVLLTLVVFALSVPMVMAQGTAPSTSPDKPAADKPVSGAKPAVDKPAAADKPATGATTDKGINCCVKGSIQHLKSDADCAKAGGKVVKDAKECSK